MGSSAGEAVADGEAVATTGGGETVPGVFPRPDGDAGGFDDATGLLFVPLSPGDAGIVNAGAGVGATSGGGADAGGGAMLSGGDTRAGTSGDGDGDG